MMETVEKGGMPSGASGEELGRGGTWRGSGIREAYADWLGKYNFDYFFTATFRQSNRHVPASDTRVYDMNTGEYKRTEPEERRGSYTGGTPRIEPSSAIKGVWDVLHGYWHEKIGERPYYVDGCNVKRGFLVAEPHQSGDLHIHGIIAGGLPKQEPIRLPWYIWNRLFHNYGRAKVEAPRKSECVNMYCAKYLLKQQHRACDYYEILGDKVYWRSGVLQKSPLERELLRQGAEYDA